MTFFFLVKVWNSRSGIYILYVDKFLLSEHASLLLAQIFFGNDKFFTFQAEYARLKKNCLQQIQDSVKNR